MPEDAHLSLEVFAKWLAGDLEADELYGTVLPHFLKSCPVCAERHREIERMKEEVGHWDERVAVFEGREAPALVAELLEHPFDEQLALVANEPGFQTWAVCQLLLRKSLEAGFEDPATAANLAELAIHAARHLEAAYDPNWIANLRARAYAYLGNARRTLGELRSAETAFRRAEAHLAESMTGNPLVEAEILDMKSSLLRDQRRFEEALTLTERALRLYRESEDSHGVGMAQLKKAKLLEESGNLASAVELLQTAVQEIDAEAEPQLSLYARHNLVTCLSKAGRHGDAARLLPAVKESFSRLAKPLDQVRLHWTEARIAHGLGRADEAEHGFRQVQQEFLQRGMGYDAALVSLDLAVLYAQQHRVADLKRLAAEIMPLFQARDVHREAMAALVMFQKACEEERLTVQLAHQIAGTLLRERRS